MKESFVDHAATTYVDERVLAAMQPYFSASFANPSSFHTPGMRAKEAVTAARATIAKVLNAREDEVIFTSGGTEADNLAVIGIPRAHAAKGKHVITTTIEHHAVLEPLEHMAKMKEIELTILPVDKYGQVSVEDVEKALRP